MFTIIFFIAGLIIGSFLNMLVYRLRLVDTILGRSKCPKCGTMIAWYDNIPLLSFILLRAKCRECQDKISWQYPVVELLSGVIFMLVGKYFFVISSVASWWEAGFYLVIFSLFMVLLVYDWKFMEVPIVIFWIMLGVVVVYLLANAYLELQNGVNGLDLLIVKSLLGGLISWLFFFSLVFFSKEKWMGWGDVYIGFLAGLLLGWQYVFMGLMLSFGIGSIYAIIIMTMKKETLKSQVPFIPFLAIGTIMAIFIQKIFPEFIKYFFIV